MASSAPQKWLKRRVTNTSFPLTQCALCESEFDDAEHAEHAARRLECGHTFCTACIENGLFKGAKVAGLHRRYFFKCACCSDHSHVIAQRASRLLHFANRLADREPPFRLTIKRISGEFDVLIVSSDMLVSDVKMLVSDIHPTLNCGLQRLSVLVDESDDGYRLLENQKSLADYGICGNAIVALAMADKFEFKLIGMDTTGALEHGLVRGTCVHNDVLFLSEMRCVRKWSIPDARLIATFGSLGSGPGQFKGAAGICTSPDGELLFVADLDNLRVQVLRSSDGAPVRAFDATTLSFAHIFNCRALKMAPNGDLFVSCSEKAAERRDSWFTPVDSRILVIDTQTGVLKREIGPTFFHDDAIDHLPFLPFSDSFCLSSDGLLLFVAHRDESVLVFDSNGVYQRSIVCPPWCPKHELEIVRMWVSKVRDRDLLFAIDSGFRSREWYGCIRVFECSTGEQISEFQINVVNGRLIELIAVRVTSTDAALTSLDCWYSYEKGGGVTMFSATASS